MAKRTERQRVPDGKFLLQVFVDVDLHKAFKIKCLEKDTTMAAQIESLIKDFVKAKGAKA